MTTTAARGSKVSWEDIIRTGPDTLGGRFMRRFWHPICLTSDVESGRARRERIMGEFVTLYRSETGTIHAVADRCPHRGTQLSAGWVEGDCIRCFYHGWKFAGDGRCVEQPAENDAFAAKTPIRGYPVRDYLGLVFIYMGEGAAPEFPTYPEVEDDVPGTILVTQSTCPVPCNFFQRVENAVDQVHVAFAHRDVYAAEGVGDLPDYWVEETDYGICAHGEREGLEERLTHYHMPNLNVLMVPPGRNEVEWAPFVTWRVPVDDESYRNFNLRRIRLKPGTPTDNLYPDRSQEQVDLAVEVLAGRKRLADVDPNDRALLIAAQDNIAQMAQGPMVDRENDHLGKSDTGVILLRKLWREEIQKLADGQPLRVWRRPAGGLTLKSGADKAA